VGEGCSSGQICYSCLRGAACSAERCCPRKSEVVHGLDGRARLDLLVETVDQEIGNCQLRLLAACTDIFLVVYSDVLGRAGQMSPSPSQTLLLAQYSPRMKCAAFAVPTSEVVAARDYFEYICSISQRLKVPALAGGVKACRGGASRVAGGGVEVTSLGMQNMCNRVTVGWRRVESGSWRERTDGFRWTDGQMAMNGVSLETRGGGRSMYV
jgi:hypothetical protein